MSKKKNTFSEQIGKAIAGCGQTRYRIHKETGLSQSTLSRLVNGREWIGREAMNTLADYLGLEISISEKRKGK